MTDKLRSADDILDHLKNLPSANQLKEKEAETEKKQTPTTAQLVAAAADKLGANSTNGSEGMLSDPRFAGAILGGAHGAWKSGASFNPLNPTFMQNNPRYNGIKPTPRPTFNPQGQTPVLHTQTGNASAAGTTAGENMMTNQTLNKSFANAPQGQIENLAEHGIKGPSLSQLHAQTGPTEVRLIGGKPFELPIGAADRAATHAPEVSKVSQAIGTLEKYAPGLKNSLEWIKGAAPTVGAIAKGAGIGGALADVGMRAYQGDKTGAGISGAGSLAGMMLAPEIGIPLAVGSMGVNYLRDHPELYHSQMTEKDKEALERMMSVGP